MTSPLDALLGAHGLDPVTPAPSPPVSFSVIMRTQGHRPHSLIEAVDSVVSQTRPAAQLLVVVHGDAAATDKVRAALSEHHDSVNLSIMSIEAWPG